MKIEKVSANCTLAVVATGGSSSGGDSGGNGGTPEAPSTLTLLAKNGSGITKFNRLANAAYVANMKQMFSAGSTIGYIEIPLVKSGALATEEATITNFNLWVFNADTNEAVGKVINGQSYTSQSSDAFGCHTIKVNVNQKFDYPFYFGYSNTPSKSDAAIAYYTEAGNYLSGTDFVVGTSIATNSGSVAIYCAIYGEGSTYIPVIPDDVNSMNQVTIYNAAANQIMAGNCYVANSTQTIPANTKIGILDMTAGGGTVTGLNVYVVNADNNTIIEMLQDETNVDTVYSSRMESDVVRLTVNKTYTHSVYFMFNAERTNNNKTGLKMVSNAGGSILLTDDEVKPTVGDVLSNFTSSYNIGHAVYN